MLLRAVVMLKKCRDLEIRVKGQVIESGTIR